MAGYWKFKVDQGSTWAVAMTITDRHGIVDLTGYRAHLQLRESISSPLPLLDLSTDDGTITVDGPAGLLSWEVPDGITATWTWRHAVYGLEIESAGGRTRPLLAGEVVVTPEVVR